MSLSAVSATDAKIRAPGTDAAPPQRNAERRTRLNSRTSRIGNTRTLTTSDQVSSPANTFDGSTTTIHRQANVATATINASSAALRFTSRLRHWAPRTSPTIRKP